ncbi:DUF885 domain-containing protein [Vicingus serpentipes]|uniref:DUF885 domain-containing protein n=1 Tax=Vicingus serpentipes TaxID=1926625 RepID=A0A5C6RU96_9FLAO|nr:DUF885 domain-containing protein [Vicingus serpentipes]TXB65871.1 DUF885 domain-containing protein [Vicingus serpentipes]
MKNILYIIPLAFMMACGNNEEKQVATPVSQDAEFETYKEHFIAKLWETSPGWASYAGLHEYDSIVVIPNEANQQKTVAAFKALQTELAAFDVANLNTTNVTDYYLIENQLASTLWYDSEFKSGEWNPANYGVAGSVSRLLNGRYDVLEVRLRAILARLAHTKAYYEQAQQNITTPTLEHTTLAIGQSKGGLYSFGQNLIDSVNASTLTDDEKALFMTRIEESKTALNDYIAFLENKKDMLETTGTAKSFRIGKEVFAKKFELDINSDYTAEEIYNKALKRKEELHQQMITIADTLWNTYLAATPKPEDKLKMVSALITEISKKHVARDEFIPEIRKQLPELVAFVNEKDLLTQNPDKPLVVRETPLYMRGGGAGASVSAPGPYDKDADTYYNVTPLDDYTDEQAESYLREYNHYVLQVLNIHEAIPGHYTQLVYSNESPSLIKSLLGNGAMIEGWAVYTELMMLEEGYNNSPEMWLMYSKWHLRVVCNTILDYSVHSLDMSKEDAMDLLMNQAFQEQAEADGKWKRATLSQVQLCSYFTGFTEIYDLRSELKAKQGDQFSLKKFHEEFLSYGSSPVRYIKKLMMEGK